MQKPVSPEGEAGIPLDVLGGEVQSMMLGQSSQFVPVYSVEGSCRTVVHTYTVTPAKYNSKVIEELHSIFCVLKFRRKVREVII